MPDKLSVPVGLTRASVVEIEQTGAVQDPRGELARGEEAVPALLVVLDTRNREGRVTVTGSQMSALDFLADLATLLESLESRSVAHRPDDGRPNPNGLRTAG